MTRHIRSSAPARVTLGFAIFALCVMLGIVLACLISVLHVGASADLARHSHARYVAERHHAARVHNAALVRRAHVLAHREYLVALTTPIAVCEEGGWIGYADYNHPDSLGITRDNWYGNGGGADLRPFVQAKVELRFDARYHIAVPDQGGVCYPY